MHSREKRKHVWKNLIRITEEKEAISVFIMVSIGILVYFFLGEWIFLEDDSYTYMKLRLGGGVMPVYPLLLMLMQKILGLEHYLSGMVVLQSGLAILCTLFFTLTLQKMIKFKNIERIPIFILCMLPYMIDIPAVGMTHYILTEGISYSLFYIYFSFVLMTVWTNKYIWFILNYLAAFLLAFTRSQLIIVFIFSGVLFTAVCFRRAQNSIKKRVCAVFAGTFLALIMMLGGYKAVYGICGILESKQEEPVEKKADVGKASVDSRSTDNQLTALILIRGFWEADEDDVELFEDEMMRFIFKEAYKIAKENGHLYSEKEDKFDIAGDLCNGFMVSKIEKAIVEYDKQFPGMRDRTYDDILREMGITIILHHFVRFAVHAVILMIPSFINSIFFRKAGLEFMCGIIVLILYMIAAGKCCINLRKKENQYITEGMIAVLVFNVILVGVINVIFVGHQRYVVYAMGIFHVFMYLLFRNLIGKIFRGITNEGKFKSKNKIV